MEVEILLLVLKILLVTDNQAPVLVCQDITVELDANGDVSITENDLIASIN